MNNLVLATILVATAAILCVRTQTHINAASARNSELTESLAAAKAAAAARREQLRRWQSISTLEQSAFRNTEAAANATQSNLITPAEIDDPPTDPSKEGYWPGKKDYFYLSKKHLRGLNYSPVTDEENISEAAALIFGMTPNELKLANGAYHQGRAELRALELAHAFPTNAVASWIRDQTGEKQTVCVPKLPQEELMAIDQRFDAALQQALGADRATLLHDRIREVFSGGRFAYDSDRIFTVIRRGDEVQYFVEDGRGSSTSGTYKPGKNEAEASTGGIPRDFAHLFLNRPGATTGN